MRVEKAIYFGNLAQAIILQAAEDLWDEDYKKESIDFFSNDGFSYCAMLASMNLNEQVRFLGLLIGLLKEEPDARRKFDGMMN